MTLALRFTDLNFKLLVVQELMYNQGLLTPVFDLRTYLAENVEREVDLDHEGEQPIPEALAYFEELEVPMELAEKVTELYMDTGNDIYHQIAPRWQGSDEIFDVQSFEDVHEFPNLVQMKLWGATKEQLEELHTRGVDASNL